MIELGSLRLGFAFSLGLGTFLAPCAFPLLPGYVAFYVGRGDGTAAADGGTATAAGGSDGGQAAAKTAAVWGRIWRAIVVGLVTSLGFFVVYGLLAGVAFALGNSILQHVSLLELVVGVLMIGIGAVMATGWIDFTAIHVPLPERRRGPMGYFAFGVVYAAAAAGCTGGLFLGLVGIALSSGPVGAVAVFGAYAAGMSVLMIAVTIAAAVGRQTLLGTLSANTRLISRIGGVVLVIAGIVQLYYFLFVFQGLETLLG